MCTSTCSTWPEREWDSFSALEFFNASDRRTLVRNLLYKNNVIAALVSESAIACCSLQPWSSVYFFFFKYHLQFSANKGCFILWCYSMCRNTRQFIDVIHTPERWSAGSLVFCFACPLVSCLTLLIIFIWRLTFTSDQIFKLYCHFVHNVVKTQWDSVSPRDQQSITSHTCILKTREFWNKRVKRHNQTGSCFLKKNACSL